MQRRLSMSNAEIIWKDKSEDRLPIPVTLNSLTRMVKSWILQPNDVTLMYANILQPALTKTLNQVCSALYNLQAVFCPLLYTTEAHQYPGEFLTIPLIQLHLLQPEEQKLMMRTMLPQVILGFRIWGQTIIQESIKEQRPVSCAGLERPQ